MVLALLPIPRCESIDPCVSNAHLHGPGRPEGGVAGVSRLEGDSARQGDTVNAPPALIHEAAELVDGSDGGRRGSTCGEGGRRRMHAL